MKIIISPAKKMRIDDEVDYGALPVFIDKTEILLNEMQRLTLPQLQKLWACNDAIAKENYQRILNMRLTRDLTPAVLAYDGLQYSHMGTRVFETDAWNYICSNLRILSGFYGILRADDGVTPYRLEMQTKLAVGDYKNLYEFWGDTLYKQLVAEDKIILNLASKEYSKAVEAYLTPDITFVTCVFACGEQDNYKVKATEAKMARGYMVRWCAENNIKDIADVQKFDAYGYEYCEKISDNSKLVFIKKDKKQRI